jgi:hypothetical protein
VALADYDRDGWIDIYVANDRSPCFLFKNNQGTFSEVALPAGVAYNSEGNTFAGMGVDFQDYNNDGFPDLIITTLTNETYVIYENNKNGTFKDVRYSTGVAQETGLYTGWGIRFLDYDNDGWKDIFTANSHVLDNVQLFLSHVTYLQPPLLLRNLASGKFENVSSRSGKIFAVPMASRGTAVGDLDNDGDQDVVVSNLNGRPSILINEGGNQNNWLTLRLIGRRSNADGIGALVKITAGGHSQYQTVTTTSSYLSASDPRVHFGVGKESSIQRLEISWPSGASQMSEDLKPNQILDIREPEG